MLAVLVNNVWITTADGHPPNAVPIETETTANRNLLMKYIRDPIPGVKFPTGNAASLPNTKVTRWYTSTVPPQRDEDISEGSTSSVVECLGVYSTT